MDSRKKDRVITLSKLDYTAGDLTTIPDLDSHRIRMPLEKSDKDEAYFIANEYSLTTPDDSVYHIPFIFNEDGTPWHEANLFFYRQSIDVATGYSTTDELRRKASQLYDFKVFCEDYKVKITDADGNQKEVSAPIDYLDFSASRPGNRPSYKYFVNLLNDDSISPENLNQRTLVVYSFYKFLAELPGITLDITRVEKTKKAYKIFENGFGKEVELRGQTVPTSAQTTPVPLGYVRDEGEDLRPLSNEQRKELVDVLGKEFHVDERLIHLIALNTGARKQSIFTMRMKHIRMLTEEVLDRNQELVRTAGRGEDGTYILKAGPKTGIDTKFNKIQTLYFPNALIQQIKMYANSKVARDRRELFKSRHGDILSDDDMYVFLSTHGNCHYMAKDDPRYRKVKTRPKGEHTDYLKKKLLKHVSSDFPEAFTFHWQRATYAFTYYQYLAPLVAKGILKPGDDIRKIQQRLHHRDRLMTEHYLKLFTNFDEKIEAQERYEERLFAGIGI